MKQVTLSKAAFLTAMVSLEADARHDLIGLLIAEGDDTVTIVLPADEILKAA
jgi:hypothetical protein